jgi:protein-disulfide isomerase
VALPERVEIPAGETRSEAVSRLEPPVRAARDHIRGDHEAAVMLVEYGDYECPACGLAHGVLPRLLAQSQGRIALVFRNFPLSAPHPHAESAAEAAEAAGAQGRFWEMHDVLFQNQDALGVDSLIEYADALALDLVRFAEDLDSHRFAARVREDFLSGVRSSVSATPTFFINGLRHDGGLQALGAALAAALPKALSQKETYR